MSEKRSKRTSRETVDALLAFSTNLEDELAEASDEEVRGLLAAQGTDTVALHLKLTAFLGEMEAKAKSGETVARFEEIRQRPKPHLAIEEIKNQLNVWMAGPLGKNPMFAGARNFEKMTEEDLRAVYEDALILQEMEAEDI